MTESKICTCPSGDGSLRWPCPAHPAVDQADVAAKLTFINGRPAMCGCQVEYSDGGGEYSDVIYVTLCAKHSGSAILDLVATNRIALTPEYEGQWHADLYLDREIPLAKVEGATPAEAVIALMSAERIDPEQESVEQAGGDRWDALQSIMEWTASENIPDERKLCLIRNAARAALAQPSPALPPFAEKVLAKLRRFYDCAEDFESGGVDIGRHWLDLLTQLGLLNRVQRSPALWEISQQGEDLLGMPQPSPAPELPERGTQHRFGTNEQSCRHDFAGVWWNDNGETKTGRECRHCGFFVADVAEQAEAERPEVFGLERYRVEKTGQGFWPYCVRAGDGTRELFVGHLKQCKRVAAQLATAFEDGKFIAQHESIVGGLRAEITQLRQHKNDYMDAGQETYRALQNEIREREAEIARLDGLVSGRTAERDAALARVAELEQKSAGSWTVDTSCGRPILMYEGCSVIEDQTAYEVIRMIKWIGELERQEPVATVAKVPGEDWNSLDFHRDLQDMQPGTKFYAAPVAQAQQLHDLDKQCRDDVARALGLRPNQERGFAWSYLLASIKSCVKASEDSAQAQHSVPEGVTIERDVAGTIHIKVGDFDFIQLQYQRPYTDNASTWKLAERIASLLAAAPGTEVPQAWLDVQAERRRQITAEGWTPDHDDLYCAAELPRAAAAYILSGANDEAPAIWPFSAKWWKPRDARANYMRAGALILAEIERLDRAAERGKEVGHE
ncbi:hypothetical protein [Pseudomonas aeruginosa]|uniref:hypothetical protein n=1 Tax=Pseudomonas aeruginosa TaxID=287 RepID=UPI000AEF7462|nr:hypothetical protein [Pseudomonas aeruginosa]MDL5562149.1 hypothetical protein [Pseudomonas aeruginosa]RCM60204.1 hypothetical protein PA37_03371 [Pseudomonas aeruginosa]RCM67234.1 hypothetical protein PA33_02768 [Pseudomonas aeruginosa]RCM70242.1 hypothetical protein PA31_03811 [Pseudomonas aeruginosa]RCM77558.1 hypothetical protein PA35_03496 [Pseudomonas aeruginosa]